MGILIKYPPKRPYLSIIEALKHPALQPTELGPKVHSPLEDALVGC
jgi:hypothetical protein